MTKALPGRRNKSTADKIWAVGLAGATCVGLVGVIGVKTAEAQAQKNETATAAEPVAVSSSGLTQEQLDVYAAQLDAQRVQLANYSNQLTLISNQLVLVQQQQLAVTPVASSKKAPASNTAVSPAKKPAAASGGSQANTPVPVSPPPLRKPTTVIQSAPAAQKPAQTVTKTS